MLHKLGAAALEAERWLDRQPLGRLLLGTYLFALALALVVGLGYSFRSGIEMLDYDEWEYWQLSGSLLGGEFNDPGRRTLAYPAMLALLRLVSDNFQFVQVALVLLATTAVPLLAHVMLRMGASRLPAVLAAAVLACWPPHLFLATSFYSEALALPVLLLFLGLLPRRNEAGAGRLPVWLLCGVLLGLVAHVRTMYQLFIPVVLLILLFESWSLRAALGRWALIIVGFLLAVLPWSAYVSDKTGAPVLLTANGGETLAGGFNAELYRLEGESMQLERRSTWLGPGKWVPSDETGYLSPAETELPYAEQDRLLRERTVAWLIANPGDAVYLTTRKLTHQWGFYPLTRNGTVHLLVGNIPTMALLALFLAALALQPASRRLGARFWLMPLFVTGIAVISWGSWRFRHPADAAMIAVVAVGVVAWLTTRRAAGRPVGAEEEALRA